MKSQPIRKVTVRIPAELVEHAMVASGEGLTATIIKGLKLLVSANPYDQLRKMRGHLNIDIRSIRDEG